MLHSSTGEVRTADLSDLQRLANLVHFEQHVHRHLDYRPPLDWLGAQPFLVLEHRQRITAALACPPDPPQTAWIRLFAVTHNQPPADAWSTLWTSALAQLVEHTGAVRAAAIPMSEWFADLLAKNNFEQTNRIVMLAWEGSHPPERQSPPGTRIRPMTVDDLPLVASLDASAFAPVWQNSLDSLDLAYRQSAVATLAEFDGQPVGYQISTPTPAGGHLARLAVHPSLQGRHIGQALLRDVLAQFTSHGARCMTVNTQADNGPSLALYQDMGFRLTGESYPFFEISLRPRSEPIKN